MCSDFLKFPSSSKTMITIILLLSVVHFRVVLNKYINFKFFAFLFKSILYSCIELFKHSFVNIIDQYSLFFTKYQICIVCGTWNSISVEGSAIPMNNSYPVNTIGYFNDDYSVYYLKR